MAWPFFWLCVVGSVLFLIIVALYLHRSFYFNKAVEYTRYSYDSHQALLRGPYPSDKELIAGILSKKEQLASKANFLFLHLNDRGCSLPVSHLGETREILQEYVDSFDSPGLTRAWKSDKKLRALKGELFRIHEELPHLRTRAELLVVELHHWSQVVRLWLPYFQRMLEYDREA